MKIYITNLGKYNEGHLIGKWLELPATDEELEETFKEIGINEQYEECFIADYECEFKGITIGEYSSITELNKIAEKLNEIDEDEQKIYSAIMENEGCTLDEAIERKDDKIIIELDNMTFNTDVELAESYIVQMYGSVEGLDRETLERYFDFESFGRDLGYDFYINDDGTKAISN